jgi:hypothetical protein
MMEMSTTRGLPFEPSAASKARTQAVRMAEEQRRQDRREHGRRLDQIELSYRQHRPPQQQDWR